MHDVMMATASGVVTSSQEPDLWRSVPSLALMSRAAAAVIGLAGLGLAASTAHPVVIPLPQPRLADPHGGHHVPDHSG